VSSGYAAQNSESRRTDICRKFGLCLEGESGYDDDDNEGLEVGLESACCPALSKILGPCSCATRLPMTPSLRSSPSDWKGVLLLDIDHYLPTCPEL
jgi:hypothetical protein